MVAFPSSKQLVREPSFLVAFPSSKQPVREPNFLVAFPSSDGLLQWQMAALGRGFVDDDCDFLCDDKFRYLCVWSGRSDMKESRESSGKLKTKHKLSDASSEADRAHKESRHESYSRDAEKTQHREEKRNDVRTSADRAHDVDARLKDRSHRTDTDIGDGDRGHRAAERDQLSADDQMISGNRSGDGHRRSAETAAGKPADERGEGDAFIAQ